MWEIGEFEHSIYPHQWGALYDCPGCESQCFCDPNWDPEEEMCVHCALLSEEL